MSLNSGLEVIYTEPNDDMLRKIALSGVPVEVDIGIDGFEDRGCRVITAPEAKAAICARAIARACNVDNGDF